MNIPPRYKFLFEPLDDNPVWIRICLGCSLLLSAYAIISDCKAQEARGDTTFTVGAWIVGLILGFTPVIGRPKKLRSPATLLLLIGLANIIISFAFFHPLSR